MTSSPPPGFQSNPALNTLRVPGGWPGTPVDQQGRFVNLHHPYRPNWVDALRWKVQRSPFQQEKKAERWNPPVFSDDSWLDRSDDLIVWLGHSTFYIRLGGIQLLTDPVFEDILLVKRRSAFPLDARRLVNLDYVLLSHDHRDHLDERSLKQVAKQNPDARYLTGLGMTDLVHAFTQSAHIEEAGWYQCYTTGGGGVTITFVPSRHWSTRSLSDTNQRLWGGFVIESEKTSILFGGDSGYDAHYKQLASVFGPIDYAILGIGAYEPAWFMGANHQSPADALRGFTELNAAHFIPMHYGTFDLSDEPMSQPLKDLHAAAHRAELDNQLTILGIGQPLVDP